MTIPPAGTHSDASHISTCSREPEGEMAQSVWHHAVSRGEPWSRRDSLILLLLFVAGAVLRFGTLTAKPFWIAEVQAFPFAWQGGFFDNWMYSAGDLIGFFYHKLCATLGLPATPFVARAHSALLGTFMAPVLFFILRRKFTRQVSALTALLVAISVPLVSLSQQSRFYIGVATFASWSMALELACPPSRRKFLSMAIFDSLAVLSHPFGILWAGTRWGFVWITRPNAMWRYRRFVIPAMAAPLLFVGLQFVEILTAKPAFLELHEYFSLGTVPPGFTFFSELVGHFAAGSGIHAGIMGFLLLAGVVSLSQGRLRTAQFAVTMAFVAPVVVLMMIWLGHARFSFAHIPGAAFPVYFLAAIGMLTLSRCVPSVAPRRLLLLVLLALVGGNMLAQQWRYHRRETRLELGADFHSACQFLGEKLVSGDVILTHYDKYFTSFAYECGQTVPADIPVVTPRQPKGQWTLNFLHLKGDNGTFALPLEQMVSFDEFEHRLTPGHKVYLLLPYRELITGDFSETYLWWGATGLYGPLEGVTLENHPEAEYQMFPTLALVWFTVPPRDKLETIMPSINSLLEEQWPIL